MRLTWKKQAREKGSSRIGQPKRGYYLRLNGETLATVSHQKKSPFYQGKTGWYWSCRNNEKGIPYKNTCDRPQEDIEVVKAECKAFILKCLEKTKEV